MTGSMSGIECTRITNRGPQNITFFIPQKRNDAVFYVKVLQVLGLIIFFQFFIQNPPRAFAMPIRKGNFIWPYKILLNKLFSAENFFADDFQWHSAGLPTIQTTGNLFKKLPEKKLLLKNRST